MAGVNIPLNRNDITELPAVLVHNFLADDACVPFFFESIELVSRNDEFRIHAEELFGINGIAREKIVERLIFIHALKPVCIRHFRNTGYLFDLVAVRQRQRVDEGDRVPGDEPA